MPLSLSLSLSLFVPRAHSAVMRPPDPRCAVVLLSHSTYFSGMKLRWMLDNVPAVAEGASNGTALFGTIESWLIWNLSGGPEGGIHVSDVSNASRTMLMDLASCSWHEQTCTTLDIPMAMLP